MAGGEIRSIGFIGLGDMGTKQAMQIARLPVSLTVFDVRREAMEPFAGIATLADNLASLAAQSDLVGLCVQDDAQVNACADELLPAMRPGSIMLIHATVAPETVTALAARAASVGVEVMDAPVTRTRMTNDGPFLFCPIGGTQEQKDRVQHILDTFATDTLLAGPTGAAMALKICNNLVSWCEILVGIEVVRLAQAAGVSVEDLLGLMGKNGVLTPPMNIFARFTANPPDDERWRQAMRNNAVVGEKDVRLAEQLASNHGVDLPLGTAIRTLLAPALKRLGGS